MNKRKKKTLIWVVVALVVVIAGIFSFGNFGKQKEQTVTVGVVSPSKQDEAVWNQVKKTAKSKYNVDIKLKTFTDYNQPNKALQSGSIDLNAFQHKAFLNAWNKANHGTLVSIGKTFITPIHLYSNNYRSVKSLPDGATIAIPNDASNESRALYVLQSAGLITLKKNTGALATISSIAKNPKNLKIKEVAADQAARTLSSVDAAVVNTNYAVAAKISTKKSIFTEPVDKNSEQWINLIAAQKKDRNKEAYKDVVKAYQTEKVKKVINEQYKGMEKPAWDIKLK
ncbi:MetQ/NlpA family ABC transporter substrate-binding protein [Limosilactobacillus mucosae]|uniref:Lipoprotein n=1 Tax=Limosilactobacillus mucosae TaxID=97478 RepID=A0AAJ1HVU1_LIMMU|nr:MetQ/NlpA family ABC transporter substrate-binding protein [Limosilactobacillus mucosae]MDC2829440.1 MetQ/NlpA family ABC transporter substrate-binding protein [Limosilactobacillus mucosae]MDC2837123.1 MetQ/NlpA family ABC transporter substrate-binding protein [Limosilactobacillus mucosae]MDC2849338.1 MetQ/NlpA family ABC transporter substrate-binding protein [Limosilactobacillus mucosae]MDC2853035.1 MetQ/NlpA family ABC transporter substrate-binding protein [Limosilactobacillus mucosae]